MNFFVIKLYQFFKFSIDAYPKRTIANLGRNPSASEIFQS